jgi:AraC-like DNA-binding protein
MLILYEVGRDPERLGRPEKTAAVLAGHADEYLRTHFHEPLSRATIASELYSNADYLGRIYHQVYGITLTEAIQRRRLEHSRRLLLESRQSIEQVARESGFNDAGYFRRLFKRQEGITPFMFRRLHAQMHINTE